MTVVNYLHFSGRYSKPAASVEHDVNELVKKHSLLSFTEFEIDTRERALNTPGFHLAHIENKNMSGEDGEAVLARKEEWDLLYSDAPLLTNERYVREGGATTPQLRCLRVILRHHPTGKIVALLVTHLPAHVQGHGGFYQTIVQQRVTVYREGVKGLKRVKRDTKKRWRPNEFIVTSDWNLDIKQAWVRAFLKMSFPSLHPNFSAPYPSLGSLGNRIIDITLTTMKVRKPGRILQGFPSSDHRPVETVLEFNQ